MLDIEMHGLCEMNAQSNRIVVPNVQTKKSAFQNNLSQRPKRRHFLEVEVDFSKVPFNKTFQLDKADFLRSELFPGCGQHDYLVTSKKQQVSHPTILKPLVTENVEEDVALYPSLVKENASILQGRHPSNS
jgi:hypothetical protein